MLILLGIGVNLRMENGHILADVVVNPAKSLMIMIIVVTLSLKTVKLLGLSNMMMVVGPEN
ncbi:hypothetical protein [Brevibacillus laterosporus]|nr:hypothetical protein [Brevibacillus laterosporus]